VSPFWTWWLSCRACCCIPFFFSPAHLRIYTHLLLFLLLLWYYFNSWGDIGRNLLWLSPWQIFIIFIDLLCSSFYFGLPGEEEEETLAAASLPSGGNLFFRTNNLSMGSRQEAPKPLYVCIWAIQALTFIIIIITGFGNVGEEEEKEAFFFLLAYLISVPTQRHTGPYVMAIPIFLCHSLEAYLLEVEALPTTCLSHFSPFFFSPFRLGEKNWPRHVFIYFRTLSGYHIEGFPNCLFITTCLRKL
jgi:hypothetical protein